MQQSIKQTLRETLADRPFFALLLLIFLASIVYILYVVLTIEPRDIQVITQYSAFGEARFYKEKWYYLYSFVALGLTTAFVNTSIMLKLYSLGRRGFGIVLGWVTLILLFVMFRYTYEVMHFAFL